MTIVRRLAQKLIWPSARKRDPYTDVPPGINTVDPAHARIQYSALSGTEITYSLNLDIGEIGRGHHLIAQSVTLTDEHLYFVYAFAPERTGEIGAEIWLNMAYGADDSPPDANYTGAGDEVRYDRPSLQAKYAWFDFFHPDYEWMDHIGRHGPDADYLRNRISRLTVILSTGEAHLET
jgi:hypothetical protein